MTLHPQSKAFLAAVAEANAPQWYERELSDARSVFDTLPFFGEPPEIAEVVDESIAGVTVRIYKPGGDSAAGGIIVFFHGGGWVLGSIASHDVLCRRLAIASGASVVSVDYRQPPEAPFPAAIEDCFTVCDVLSMDHASYGIGGPLVVAGDSAGGNLAAAVCLMSRNRGGPELAGQVLIYPVLDGSMSGQTYQEYADGFGLTAETMQWFWQNYTGGPNSPSRRHPLASLMDEETLDGLPPAHIVIAEYDVLRSEAERFVARLKSAGVPTTSQVYKGMLHGFIHFAEAFDDSLIAIDEIGRYARGILSNEP